MYFSFSMHDVFELNKKYFYTIDLENIEKK